MTEIVVARVRHTDFKPVRHLLARTGHESMNAIEFHSGIVCHELAYLARRGPQSVGLIWVEKIEDGAIVLSRLSIDLPGSDEQIAQQLIMEVMWAEPDASRVEMLVDEYAVDQQKFLSSCGFIGKPQGNSILFSREA